MKKLKSQEKLSLLPNDCWTVITSYFESPQTAISIMTISKSIREGFFSRIHKYFENVAFTIKSLEMETIFPFVRNVIISPCLKDIWKNYPGDEIQNDQQIQKTGECTTESENLLKKMYRVFPNVKSIIFRKICKLPLDQPENRKKIPCTLLSMNKNIQSISIQELTPDDDQYKGYSIFQASANMFNKIFNQQLSKLPRLEVLELKILRERNTPLILDLKELKSLKSLTLETLIFCENVKVIFSSSTLEKLFLFHYLMCFEGEDNTEIYLPKLRKFSFSGMEYEYYRIGEYQPNLVRSEFDNDLNIPRKIIEYCSQNLDEIKLDCAVANGYNDSVLSKCENLSVLDVSDNNNFNGSIFNPFCRKLLKLNMKCCRNIVPMNIEQPFSNLRELDMSYCYQKKFDDSFLLNCFPNIEKLIMIGCTQDEISNKGFSKFKKLRFLNITECYQKSLDSKIFPMLFKNNEKLENVRIEKERSITRISCRNQLERILAIREPMKSDSTDGNIKFIEKIRSVHMWENPEGEYLDPVTKKKKKLKICEDCKRNFFSKRYSVCSLSRMYM